MIPNGKPGTRKSQSESGNFQPLRRRSAAAGLHAWLIAHCRTRLKECQTWIFCFPKLIRALSSVLQISSDWSVTLLDLLVYSSRYPLRGPWNQIQNCRASSQNEIDRLLSCTIWSSYITIHLLNSTNTQISRTKWTSFVPQTDHTP